MFISGFLLGYSRYKIGSLSDYFNFIEKKFNRLIVPYLSISTIILIIKFTVGSFVPLRLQIENDFWKDILFYPYGGYATFLWFIYVLFIIFLVFPVFQRIFRKPVLLFYVFALLYYIPLDFRSYFSSGLVTHYILFFYIGYLYARTDLEKINSRYMYVGLISILLFILFIIYKISIINGLNELGAYAISNKLYIQLRGIIGVFTFYYLSVLIKKKIRPLYYLMSYIGVYSAAIYLLHTIFMGAVKNIFLQMPFGTSAALNNLLTVLAGIILPILTVRFITNKNELLSRVLLGVRKVA
jgi:fucose 4-O-acetylase-like acetyltransferase